MFDVESVGSKKATPIKSSPLSVVSEDQEGPRPKRTKPIHYQLNSSELFKQSSTSSLSGQSAEDTFPETSEPPSQYEMPGERLYYQYQQNLVRKMKDLQRWKYEVSQQEKDMLTFTPHINKNTHRILEARQENPQSTMKAQQRKLQKLKQIEQSEKLKNYEVLKQCTFKPKTSKKTQQLTRNRSDNVFHNLYRQSQMKEIRQKVKQQHPQPPRSPDGPKLVQDFLQRNDQYIEKTRKKMTILQEKALQYDLSSGEKLFTPKISKFNLKAEGSRSGAIFNKHDSLHNLSNKLREKYEDSVRDTHNERDELDHGRSQGPNLEACFENS